MEHLTREQLEALRGHLEESRAGLAERVQAARLDQLDLLAPDVGDRQDMAVGEKDRHRAKLVTERDRERLADVEAALARMEDGSYGLCEDTDEPIPYARLAVFPATRYSVDAQQLREQEESAERAAKRDEGEAY